MPFNGTLYNYTSNINLISTEPEASDFIRWLFAYQNLNKKGKKKL